MNSNTANDALGKKRAMAFLARGNRSQFTRSNSTDSSYDGELSYLPVGRINAPLLLNFFS